MGGIPTRPTSWDRIGRRRIKLWLSLVGILLACWLLASLAVAHRLTSRARPRFVESLPEVGWGKFESHRLKTQDGLEIGAWFIEGEEHAPTVLLLHGNKGSRANCLSRARIFVSQGYSAMLISLRAHGDSTGDFNDIGYSARQDVVAAVDFLGRARPGKPVIVHGTSLGAAAAVFASKELAHRVRGYILESPYRDLKIAVRNRTENELPPILDWIAYQGLVTVSPLILPELERISPLEAIRGIPSGVPVLILAGDEDRLARPEEARALLQRVQGHGRMVLFERTGHVGFLDTDPSRYRQVVLDFAADARKR